MAHISLVTLGVDDLGRATAFYESMGWQRSSATVEHIVTFLQGGTVALALFGRDDLAKDAHVEIPGRSGFGKIALAMNVESERSVDTVLNAAEEAGGRITKSAERTE